MAHGTRLEDAARRVLKVDGRQLELVGLAVGQAREGRGRDGGCCEAGGAGFAQEFGWGHGCLAERGCGGQAAEGEPHAVYICHPGRSASSKSLGVGTD